MSGDKVKVTLDTAPGKKTGDKTQTFDRTAVHTGTGAKARAAKDQPRTKYDPNAPGGEKNSYERDARLAASASKKAEGPGGDAGHHSKAGDMHFLASRSAPSRELRVQHMHAALRHYKKAGLSPLQRHGQIAAPNQREGTLGFINRMGPAASDRKAAQALMKQHGVSYDTAVKMVRAGRK